MSEKRKKVKCQCCLRSWPIIFSWWQQHSHFLSDTPKQLLMSFLHSNRWEEHRWLSCHSTDSSLTMMSRAHFHRMYFSRCFCQHFCQLYWRSLCSQFGCEYICLLGSIVPISRDASSLLSSPLCFCCIQIWQNKVWAYSDALTSMKELVESGLTLTSSDTQVNI